MFIFIRLCYNVVSTTYIMSCENDGKILNDKFGGISEEAIVGYLKVLCRHLPRGTEKHTEVPCP
jgi:hypothetical protein